MIELKNYDELFLLQNLPEEGEQAVVGEDLYVFKNNQWNKVEVNNQFGIKMYDYYKALANVLKPLTDTSIKAKIQNCWKTIEQAEAKYYMLLCREYNYYTLFIKNGNGIAITEEIFECLKYFYKDVLSIEVENNAICIWGRDLENNEPCCMYFFNYDAGVIECK